MSKTELKSAILASMSAEIDEWLDKQENISNGYEYETQFMKVAQKVNKILLEKSLGKLPGSRNKKTPYLFWENRSKQKPCIMPTHTELWYQQQASGNTMLAGAGICI